MNWEARIKSKAFWVALISAVALLIQMVAALFGYELKNIEGISSQLVEIVNAIFVVLTIMGITVNPTTKGIKDQKGKLIK